MPNNSRAEARPLNVVDFSPAAPQLSPPKVKSVAPWAEDMKKARLAYSRGIFEHARVFL
jgi:hypothetical protein